MSFGRNNFFDDNRRGFRNFDNESPFGNYSNIGNNFDNIRRQRSPIFNNRDPFDSMSSNNFPSFSNRNTNFGYNPQQNQEQTPSQNDSSSKIYHVPIHIEKDNANQSNSYVKINEKPNQQSNQHQSNQQQQSNYQKNNFSNQQSNQQQTNFIPNHPSPHFTPYSDANYSSGDLSNNNLSNIKERAEQEFKRQQDDSRNKTGYQQQQQQQNEYRIPIHIERDESNESSNLVRDFNKMHCPSAVRTSKPGQKQSTQTNDFIDSKDFTNVPSSYRQPTPMQNQQNVTQQSQQSNEEPKPEQQQPKKPADPMEIIQGILDEVEKYEHEIDNFSGEYQDKQYRYLDEYLTRCMLKLDTIDTNGDPNLKQARKNAIHYINKVISKLEKTETRKDKKEDVISEKEVETEDKTACENLKEGDSNQDEKKESNVNNEIVESNENAKAKEDKKSSDDKKEKKKIRKDDAPKKKKAKKELD